jgi:hypothetical protein
VKYKCFCHVDNIWDLSKEEIVTMLRKSRRFSPEEFINFYKLTAKQYIEFLRTKGFVATSRDRLPIQNEWRKEKTDVTLPIANQPSHKINWTDVDQIPNEFICAIYNVSYEVVKGKRFYDVEELNIAKEKLQNQIDKYLHDDSKEPVYSKLKPIDLIAMRVFRGYKRKEFSKLSLMPMHEISLYESKETKIPKYVAECYISVLNIKKRHIVQLREIMSGKSKQMVDDRTIPPIVKLKVWRKYNGKCAHCESEEKLHYHHIIHFAQGGQHTEDNLKLLCASCHAEEHKGEKVYPMLKKIAEDN